MNDDFIHDAYFEEMEPSHSSNALPSWNHSNGNGNKKEGFFKRCFKGIFRFMRRGFALLGFLVMILIAVHYTDRPHAGCPDAQNQTG